MCGWDSLWPPTLAITTMLRCFRQFIVAVPFSFTVPKKQARCKGPRSDINELRQADAVKSFAPKFRHRGGPTGQHRGVRRYNLPVPLNRTKRCQIEPTRRGPYTPEPVQARVISRHLSGESKREIARVEGIGRDTVGRILSQQEVLETIARYQSRLLDMVPKAIAAYEEALASDDLHLKAATATKLLEGTNVLSKGGIDDIVKLANQASPEVEERDRRLRIIAQIIGDGLERSRMFDIPLPPDLEGVRDELERIDAQEQSLQLTTAR
jgi:hypothetical protein